MQEKIEAHYESQPEPLKGAQLTLRDFILNFDDQISESWKYAMPFFLYRRKMFVYMYNSKSHPLPYLGICDGNQFEHPLLITNGRSRMKILEFDPSQDLPIATLGEVLALGKHYLDRKLG